MSDNLLTVLVVEPGKPPYPRQIQDTLHAMQEIIGGDIEATYPYEDPVALVFNSSGKFTGLQPNRKTEIPMMLCAAPFSSLASVGKPLCL